VRERLIFAARFGVLLLLFYVIVALNPVNDHVIVPFTAVVTRISAALLRLTGSDVTAAGTRMLSKRFSMDVENGCNAVETMMLFAAAVLAFNAPIRDRLLGIALGLPAIQLINLVRLISLYLLGVHRPDWFTVWHVGVWQSLIILSGVGMFMIWSSRVARHRR
jgi:exosortase H (IPTLxxWG-CTERM-specific)